MNRKHWNLLTPSRLTSLPESQQYAAYAVAYLDSAERLCSVLARSSRKATFERGAVVIYLMSHAVELFLKGAILRKAPNEHFSHGLEHLRNRYAALYPAKRYQFTKPPFEVSYPEKMSAQEIAAAKKDGPPVDQLYRYPQDKDGKPWAGAFGFEANSCLKEVRMLQSDFARLLHAYDG
jgi:hypothetical protein